MTQGKIKILIIDDSIGWIKILTLLLNGEENMMVIGTAGNLNDGPSLVKLLKTGCYFT